MSKEQPRWDGNPKKLDRLQRKDQAEKWDEEKEIKIGIRGGYTEMARPGDSIERMAKRAYETAKNYPLEKAKTHASMVGRVLKSGYPELGVVRLNRGDQLKITEKEIILTIMDKFGAHKDYRVGIGSPEIKAETVEKKEEVKTKSRSERSNLSNDIFNQLDESPKPTPFLEAIQNASSKVDGTAYVWEKVKTSTRNAEVYKLTLITGKRILVVANENSPKYRALDLDGEKQIVKGTDNFMEFFNMIREQMIAAKDDKGENIDKYNG